jgi:hypothetical protein
MARQKKKQQSHSVELTPRLYNRLGQFLVLLEKVTNLGFDLSRLPQPLPQPLRGMVDDAWKACDRAREDIEDVINWEVE